jgi:hypothetical protein
MPPDTGAAIIDPEVMTMGSATAGEIGNATEKMKSPMATNAGVAI